MILHKQIQQREFKSPFYFYGASKNNKKPGRINSAGFFMLEIKLILVFFFFFVCFEQLILNIRGNLLIFCIFHSVCCPTAG